MQNAMSLHCTFEPLSAPDALAERWKALEKKSRSSFFLSWNWVGTWLNRLARRPLVFRATRDGETVALGLFFETGPSRFLLHQSGDMAEDSIYIEFNGLLCDDTVTGLEADCWTWLTCQHPSRPLLRRPTFDLNRLSEDSFHQIEASGGSSGKPTVEAAPYANLSWIADQHGDFASALSRNSRHKLRRSITLYESQEGDLTLSRPETADDAQRYLDRLIELHQETWRARGKPGAFAPDFFEAFHRQMISNSFDQGVIDLIEIRSEEAPLGYLYNFLHRGAALSYQSGFRYDEDNRLKPGLVCHALTAQDYLDRGLDRYSFLAGDSRYKRSLATGADKLYSLRLKGDNQLTRLVGATRHR